MTYYRHLNLTSFKTTQLSKKQSDQDHLQLSYNQSIKARHIYKT